MKPPLKSPLKIVLFYIIFQASTLNAFAQSWNQIIKVTAQNNDASSARSANDLYGNSVSISGNYAIVGAYHEGEDPDGLNSVGNAGAAYILYNNAGNWVQVKKITAPVRDVGDLFGNSVSISGDYAIVGAHMEDEDAQETNTLDNSGSAYIFRKDQGGTDNWGLVKKITASTRDIADGFGYSVSISGDYAIVGAYVEDEDVNETNSLYESGSAYVFKKDQGGTDSWGQIKKITASTRGFGDRFGWSVSINGDYAIVGANLEKEDALEANTLSSSGSAYIFKKDQGGADNWGQIKKITASVRASGDNFGWSVSISGDYAIVGAPYENEDALEANTLSFPGSAYIFKKDQGGADNWGQVQKVTASVRAGLDYFGWFVSIGGDYAIVGGPYDDEDASEANTLPSAGSAYIYKKDQGGTDNWGQVQKITASVRADFDVFGISVAIDGDDIIVGAYGEAQDASEANTLLYAGSAYIFQLTPPLPVMLTTFDAVRDENQVLLNWATTMESNSDYFDIQKSGDGHVWKTLGRVLAAVKSEQLRSYSFIDYNPWYDDSPGYENLYRLKMVDVDGSFAYSRIISLSFGSNPRPILNPNPVSDKLYCNPADVAKIESITLINSAGQIMLRIFGESKTSVSVDGLTPGIYLAQIRKKAGAVQVQKVVVVR
ncbi:T9SS type A sorting domain-containing protein [Dyadobacter pollutisoli]|uniref:T9SS type A sorting domain-containing protein n=1 Tax=Dyadobacter pollutisoli TaxID=2910158 RepID=A0A9E8N7T9_9BACT|nr:T9SS type A sorting domain-containing protein [Dyadobacter pollutisoli]WAC11494.1 T9SS type A sorting domain-containing protein [Dyadobacter pollutisoli]